MVVQTAQVAPAAVPGPQVTQVRQQEPERPTLLSARPTLVPSASAVRLPADEGLARDEVAQLRAENAALRHELARLAAS